MKYTSWIPLMLVVLIYVKFLCCLSNPSPPELYFCSEQTNSLVSVWHDLYVIALLNPLNDLNHCSCFYSTWGHYNWRWSCSHNSGHQNTCQHAFIFALFLCLWEHKVVHFFSFYWNALYRRFRSFLLFFRNHTTEEFKRLLFDQKKSEFRWYHERMSSTEAEEPR